MRDLVEAQGVRLRLPLVQFLGLIVISVFFSTTQSSIAPAGTVEIFPGQDIQTAVDMHDGNTVFRLKAGIHRGQSIEPKSGNAFLGEPGKTILSGAKVLEPQQFTKEGDLWVISGQTQNVPGDLVKTRRDSRCSPIKEIDFRGTPGTWPYDPADPDSKEIYECAIPEDLYMDDRFLWRVYTKDDVRSGAWYFDEPKGKIYMGDDPKGHRIEVSYVMQAITSDSASGVTIRDLIIEKYASRAFRAAVQWSGANWAFEGNEVRLNHAKGLGARGDGATIRRNYFHHNGQIGLGFSNGANLVFENNEIAFNMTRGFRGKWEGGGLKFSRTNYAQVGNNCLYENLWNALWLDIHNENFIVHGNYAFRNKRQALFHEIGYGGRIYSNIVLDHSPYNAPVDNLYDGGIVLASSERTLVDHNIVELSQSGSNGIMVVQQRPRESDSPYRARLNNIVDNVIVYLGSVGLSGVAAQRGAEGGNDIWSTNSFDRNEYHVPNMDAKRWKFEESMTWGDFKAEGMEAEGTVNAEVECVLAYPPPAIGPTWRKTLDGCTKDYLERIARGCRVYKINPHPKPNG